jgi:hypothetical protein
VAPHGFGLFSYHPIGPLALLVANTAKAMPTRILFMAIAGMFAFNILFTGSRNGMLGLLAVGADYV